MRLASLCSVLLSCIMAASAAADDRKIMIGGLFGLTGDSAAFGQGELDGTKLAIEEWNARGGIGGRPLELEAEDTNTSQTKTLLAFEKLVSLSGHKFLLGPTWLDTFQSVVPLAERKKVVLITPSAEGKAIHHADPDNPWSFTCFYSSVAEIHALLKALRDAGYKRILGTYSQEPYFQLVKGIVEEEAPKLGLENAGSFDFDMNFTGFRTEMVKFKAKNPDVLLVFQTAENTVIDFLRSKKQIFPAVTVAGIHDFKGFLQKEETRALSEGLYFSDFELADPSFADRFKKRFGYEPILTHSNAYDAANILFQSLAQGHMESEDLRAYLLKTEFKTVTFGNTRFDAQGIMQGSKVAVFQVRDGKSVKVSPP